jgi:hypothetical protein
MDSLGRSGKDFLIVVDMEFGEGLVDVEFAVEKDLDTSVVLQHHILKGLTASLASDLDIPISGIRLNVLDYKRGTIKLRVIQS